MSSTQSLVIPPDMRIEHCTCKSGLKTAKDLEKAFKEVQKEYTRRWKFVGETAKLLYKFGFKDGVNVVGDYGPWNTYDEKDPYKVEWIVNEAIYLGTGEGTIGDLSGGIQNGDWFARPTPLKKAMKYLLASDRMQKVKLTRAQKSQLEESFNEAYHAHIHFVAPMSRVHTFIHEKLGSLGDLTEKQFEEVMDFLWEFRHTWPDKTQKVTQEVHELLELITKIQAQKTQSKAA